MIINKSLKKDALVFILVFGVLTLPFLFFNLDILLQKPFYNQNRGWFLIEVPFWDFLYKYGIFLGYILVVIALAIVSVSYWRKSLVKWRKASYFMLFVMVLGPGVLVNATFKDYWGRPRPREITEFGGKEDFVKTWVKGDTNGKSFPCGHASMGFIISIPFLFLRKRYKTWAWVFFIFGTLYGGLIGYARMVAGGHFASDVLWAAGMVWFAGIVGYYLLKVYQEIDEKAINEASQRKKGKIIVVIMGLIVPILTVSLMLATPYISKKEFAQNRDDLNALNLESLSANFPEGTVNVSFSDKLYIKYDINAFGFPNSKINLKWEPNKNTIFSLNHTGWFTEVRNNINISYPVNCSWQNRLNLTNGKVFIEIPTDTIPKNIDINLQNGDITLYVTSKSNFSLTANNTQIINNSTLNTYNVKDAPLKLNIDIIKGTLIIEDNPD